MKGMSSEIDDKIGDISVKYLDDEYIVKNFYNKLLNKSNTKGKKLHSNKVFSDFLCHEWPRFEDIYDHKGNIISKTGHKMD